MIYICTPTRLIKSNFVVFFVLWSVILSKIDKSKLNCAGGVDLNNRLLTIADTCGSM